MKNLVSTYFLEQKNIKGYLVMYVAAAVLLSCLSVIYFSSGLMFWLMKIVQLLFFAGLGIAHAVMIEKELPFITGRLQSKLSFSALLTALICAALLIFYYFTNKSMLFMALASSCAFFLPYTILQSLNIYGKIPENGVFTWYGFDEKMEPPEVVYLSSVPVTFKLVTDQSEVTTSFLFKAPLHMELGKLFNLFVLAAEKNYNIHVVSADENNRPFGWQFYAENLKGLLNIQLDPEMSIGNNKKIKPYTVIYVKRVKPNA